MPARRLQWLVALAAVAYAAGSLLLPLTAIELLGVPLVVAGAWAGGARGGASTALWAIAVTTTEFFVLGDVHSGDYVVSLAAYAAVGLGLGPAVDHAAARRRELQDALDRAEATQRLLRASQQRYRLLFEASNDAVYLYGVDAGGEPTRFVAVNDAACAALGYTRNELLELTPRAIEVPETPGQLREETRRLLREGRTVYESARRDSGGRVVPVEVSSSLTDVDGELMVLAVSRDIGDRKKAERRLMLLSLEDQLTGLMNRRGFTMLLPEQRKRAKRSGSRLLVLYGDIDGFKEVNDVRGHAYGDRVLVAVADALRRTFRETDLVARMGGDEFCVVAEVSVEPKVLTDRLDAALAEARADLGTAVHVSYGVKRTDWRGLEDIDELLACVDTLMYEAKRRRRGALPEGGEASSA